VLGPPLRRHVRAEMCGGHHGTHGPAGCAVTHLHHVAQEASGAPRVHHVRHAALEVRVAIVEHRHTQGAGPVRDARELVLRAPAREAEPMNQLELVVAQQMQDEAAALEDQVVTVVELVAVDRHARDRGHDRRADRTVGNHAVARPPALGLSLVVAHVDHGIGSDSGTVARAVGELAERYELSFEIGELSLGPDATETIARRARYTWLGEIQRRHGARYLVTAHHRDDQVETILLRLLKGSAPAGLAGIPARGRAGLVRPLLPFPKARLLAHVAALGLAVHDDPANRDPRHLRSWVRTALLPLVAERLGARAGTDVLRAGRAAARERRAWDGVLDHLPDLGL